MKSAKVDLKVQIVIAMKVNSTINITVRMVTIALDSFIWARGAKLRVNDWRTRHEGCIDWEPQGRSFKVSAGTQLGHDDKYGVGRLVGIPLDLRVDSFSFKGLSLEGLFSLNLQC